jgi:hypothetical protein
VSGALPTFVVIGAQKCGTSGLHAYLGRHPEFSMSRPKELNFFVSELNWERGVDWYRKQFDAAKPIRGESSPNYTAYPRYEGVPERMAGLIPEAKLIFMVRDPIDRIRANWIHTYSNRTEHRPLREAALDPSRPYVLRSRYHEQLSRFLPHYPLDRVLVLDQRDLLTRRRETMQSVFAFLGAQDPDYWRKRFDQENPPSADRRRRTRLGAAAARRLSGRRWRLVRGHRPFTVPFEHTEVDDELRARLVKLLGDDVSRFRELTGRDFAHWSV